MTRPTTFIYLRSLGDKGIINDIEVCGHTGETPCFILSTIISYLEASLDNLGVPYSIQCVPLSGVKRIFTQSEDEVAWRLFQIAADMLRAASVCEPTRGKVDVCEPIDRGTSKNKEEY